LLKYSDNFNELKMERNFLFLFKKKSLFEQ
jgi:hypothetical protein